MKLPKVSASVNRFGVSRVAEEKSGILPSKCDWDCGIYIRNPFTEKKKKVGNDPVCMGTIELCRKCMNVCSNLPAGHMREVCESKC
jgi:hypothetical protein